ncbi:MAG: hypothetical protein ACRD43_04805 [Pyrinomonadaceae bacterium]
MKNLNKESNGCKSPLSIGSLVVLLFVAGFSTACSDPREPFASHVTQYLERPQNPLNVRKDVPGDQVVIKGKLIPVDRTTKSISSLYGDLPDNLRPITPDEVGTIMWVNCSGRLDGEYSDGSSARSNECDLTFIDAASKQFLWMDTVITPPPAKKPAGEYSEAPDPTADILKYLAAVPRR